MSEVELGSSRLGVLTNDYYLRMLSKEHARRPYFRTTCVCNTARHGRLSAIEAQLSLRGTMMIGGHSDSKAALRYQHLHIEQFGAEMGRSGRISGRMQSVAKRSVTLQVRHGN
jgi:hypothetical protein